MCDVVSGKAPIYAFSLRRGLSVCERNRCLQPGLGHAHTTCHHAGRGGVLVARTPQEDDARVNVREVSVFRAAMRSNAILQRHLHEYAVSQVPVCGFLK